jgi:hypothetical protein
MLQVTSYGGVSQHEALLQFRDRLFPLQPAMLAQSSVLLSQTRQARKIHAGKTVVSLDEQQQQQLESAVGSLTPLVVERFLAALSGGRLDQSCSEVRTEFLDRLPASTACWHPLLLPWRVSTMP